MLPILSSSGEEAAAIWATGIQLDKCHTKLGRAQGPWKNMTNLVWLQRDNHCHSVLHELSHVTLEQSVRWVFRVPLYR